VAVSGISDRWVALGVAVFLVVIVLMVFGQAVGFGFINYDDPENVTENPHVIAGLGWKGIEWAFTHTTIDRWAPLTVLSHMADCQFYGLWGGGHVLTNVLLHTATTVLLFLVLWQMTAALWRSAIVATVFAIHPLRVEAVAWVSARGDMLCSFFFVLTLGAYLRYVRKPGSFIRYWSVAFLFALGLMAKSMLVTLPFALLLLDYWPLNRFPRVLTKANFLPAVRRLVMEKIPLFALVVVSSVATVIAAHHESAINIDDPIISRICNALVSYVIYLRQMVYPAGLAIPYLDPMNHAPVAGAIVSLALLAAISYGAFSCRGKQPWVIMGWLWYLGMLVPVIGITRISYYTHADRYTYLPQIGLYILVTWGVADLCAQVRHRQLLLAGLTAAVIAVLIFCSRVQIAYWHDSKSLWEHAIACTEDNYIAHDNLGHALLEHGEREQAIPHFQKALEIQPEYPEAHNNLGKALAEEGKADQAIPHFKKALELKPGFVEARNNLGVALFQNGQTDEAIAHYQKAIENEPGVAELHYDLGNALLQKGEVNEALESYQRALEINPKYADAHYNLGLALIQRGDVDGAIASYQKAIEDDPYYADAQNNLGTALIQKGELDEAILHFRRATEIKPGLAEAHYNLGSALLQKNQVDEAIESYQKAIEIKPEYPQARNKLKIALAQKGQIDPGAIRDQKTADPAEIQYNLGNGFLQKGEMNEAIASYEKALAINPKYAEAETNLGTAHVQKGEIDRAIDHYKKALAINPNFAEAHYDLANVFLQKGEEGEAIAHFQRVLELQPQNIQAGNNLALLLATSTNGAIRNGAQAVELGERMNQLSGGGQPVILVALAAAYAETGQFPKAVETAQKALQLANGQGNAALGETIQGHVKLYQEGKPLRMGAGK